MGYKKWILPQLNKENAMFLAEECHTDPFTALIAAARGYDDPLELEMFLDGGVIEVSPYDLIDMEKAVEVINQFAAEGEKITVFGDYDCDGITATALLYQYLKSAGAVVDYYIPNRLCEGYGMSNAAIEQLHQNGTKLIVTVDNGISANEPIDYANRLGMMVVVTDHHRPIENLPNAAAVIDPHREDNYLPFRDFAGVGVAFLLVCALSGNEPEFLLEQYAELLTIGTVADVMPIIRENRAFVKKGLEQINRAPSVGVAALLEVAKVQTEKISAGQISFAVAPRINAAGRMDSAEPAFDLLTCTDKIHAARLAEQLNEQNIARQETEKKIVAEATEKVEHDKLYRNRVIVVAGSGWHEGVLGIAAARLAEKYERPAIVLSAQPDGILKGSARSIGNFSIFSAIEGCKDVLLSYGGHSQAAGLSLKNEQLENFCALMKQSAQNQPFPLTEIHIDCKLNPAAVNYELVEALSVMEPFGVGNPQPLFGLFGLKIERIIPLSNGKHVRILASKNNCMVALLMLGTKAECFAFKVGQTVDAVVTLKSNVYNGETQVSVMVKDIRPAGLDEKAAEFQLKILDDYYANRYGRAEAAALMFDRTEMAQIYKAIRAGANTAEKIAATEQIAYGKQTVILDVLEELGLIAVAFDEQKGKHFILPECEKTQLERSDIYQKLLKEAGGVKQ